MGSTSLPDAVRRLLWDIDPKALDLARHGDYLLERVMSRGEWAAMCWLRATVPGEQLADFVRRPVPVASQKDLVCMTLAPIASRAAVRDFWDLHALLGAASVGLAEALAWYRCKYKHEDIGHVVRSLAHFADADAEPLPQPLTAPRWERIKADLRGCVQAL